MNPLLERISIDPNVCFGSRASRARRIWVSSSGLPRKRRYGDGASRAYHQAHARRHPGAIAYGAEAARERIIPVPTEPPREAQT